MIRTTFADSYYADSSFVGVRQKLPTTTTIMISLILLISHLDPSLAASVRRSATDGQPYGVTPPAYAFEPHPISVAEHVVLSPRPIVCNNNTEYECICMKPYISQTNSAKKTSKEPSSIKAPDCSVFIKTDDLPVVDMRMRHVNTEALLYTGISYEEYFKKRISSIVSHYCQHNMNECPGTTMRMSHVSQEMLKNDEDGEDLDKSVLYAEVDESEPLLKKENVVILRMDHLRGNVTRLLFILTKNDRNGGIFTENMIIDPVKVKYILASQVGPLSRVLGGINIDSVRAAKLKRNSDVAITSFASPQQRIENGRDNSTLIKGLIAVCLFFLTTYCIAFFQCIRYFWRKREARREAKLAETSLAANAEKCKNYGTCPNQRKPSRNGHVHVEEKIPLTYETIDENANDEPQPLTARQVRNWFICDTSQLPREPTFDQTTAYPDEVDKIPATVPQPTEAVEQKKESPILTRETTSKSKSKPTPLPSQATDSSETIFPPSKEFCEYVENQYNKSRASSNSPDLPVPKSPQEDPWDEHTPKGAIPPVVLLQSETPDIPIVNHISREDENYQTLRSESPTFARPRSRRGSRVDEEEGTLDLAELKPLHADDPLAEPLEVPVPVEAIKKEVDEEDRWSSSEEGDVDVYYKMSDDEDVTREELDWKKAMTKVELEKESKAQGHPITGAVLSRDSSKTKRNETPPSTPIQNGDNNNTDSEEEDVPMEKEQADPEPDDHFVYERLREELSPQPPIVVDLDTTDLDLDPIKALPPPPSGMFPDSPPESGSDTYQMQISQDMSNSSDEEDSLR